MRRSSIDTAIRRHRVGALLAAGGLLVAFLPGGGAAAVDKPGDARPAQVEDEDEDCTISADEDDPIVFGTDGDDRICAGDGGHVIFALGGDDVISSGAGDDIVHAGEGDDQVASGDGTDVVFGGRGEDRCTRATVTRCEVVYEFNEPAPGTTVRRVDEEVADPSIDPTGSSTFVYTGEETIEAGDVVNSGITEQTPEGFLGEVASVEQTESGQRVHTEPVRITEVIPYGEFDVHFGVDRQSDDGGDGPTAPDPSSPGSAAAASLPSASSLDTSSADAASSDGFELSLTDTFSCEQGVSVDIEDSVDVTPDVDWRATWNPIDKTTAFFAARLDLVAEVKAFVAQAIDCEAELSIPGPNLPPFAVPIGPMVLVVVPETGLTVEAHLFGKAGAEITGTVQGYVDFFARYWDEDFEYEVGHDLDGSFDHELRAEFGARVDPYPRLSLEPYGAGGPEIFTGPFLELTADPTADPWLLVDGGLSAGAVLRLDTWFADASYEIARADVLRVELGRSSEWPGPTITTSSLPEGRVDVPYEHQLLAEGGTPPLKWWLVDGELPQGLSLDGSGVLSGTPEVAHDAPITVGVEDAEGYTRHKEFDLVVRPAKVLIYYGNGGVDPGDFDNEVTFTTMRRHYEDRGLIVEYTDVWPDDLGPYRVIYLVAPGNDDDSGTHFFTDAQVADLEGYLPGHEDHRLVVLGDHSGIFGMATVNALLEDLDIGIRQNADLAIPNGDTCAPLTDFTDAVLTDGIDSLDPSASSSLELFESARGLGESLGRVNAADHNCADPDNPTWMAVDRTAWAPGDVVVVGDTQGLDDFAFSDPEGDGVGDARRMLDNLASLD